jgi:hypothetical protein
MTKAQETRLKNLRAKKASGKNKLTPLDLTFLKKLSAIERREARQTPR